MPRRIVPISPNDPYHISARCINREWFSLPIEVVWSVMEDYLYLTAKEFDLRIHAFVLMSNHFHLIATAPLGNLSRALLYFMRESSRELTRLAGRINQTYGARNHKTHINSFHHFMNTYKYVYQNPLRAGLCRRVEDYPYSTLNGLCGLNQITIPLVEDTLLFTPNFDESTLKWLNTRPDVEYEKEMRLALSRPQFELKASRKNKKQSLLETFLL